MGHFELSLKLLWLCAFSQMMFLQPPKFYFIKHPLSKNKQKNNKKGFLLDFRWTSISIFSYFLLLFHYSSEGNIALFTPLHLFDSFSIFELSVIITKCKSTNILMDFDGLSHPAIYKVNKTAALLKWWTHQHIQNYNFTTCDIFFLKWATLHNEHFYFWHLK